MSELADALDRSRDMIKAALESARAELGELDARRSVLETLIAQAEAALGSGHVPAATPTMTLHEAIAQILRDNGNAPMTPRALAEAINDRGLYRTRDGGPVEVNQVHARTSNYQELFDKDGALIRLREESPMGTNDPRSLAFFTDDDDGFFRWLDQNGDGYFINSERVPTATYLVLHRSTCPHFTRNPAKRWTMDYSKICSTTRGDLEDWAASTVGGDVTLCRTCFGESAATDHVPHPAVVVPTDTAPNWRLIVDAARALTAAGQTPFTRISVYEWIWRRYSREQRDRPSLDPTFQGMIKNATGGPPSACGTPLIRVSRGYYRLAD